MVNFKNGGAILNITYANEKVEKYFIDYSNMKKKLPAEWVRTIKKQDFVACGTKCQTNH